MSKKSAKKRQPVVKPAVQEAMSAAVPLGYEEMLTELEAIVADAEARLAEGRRRGRSLKSCRMAAQAPDPADNG